jgi:HNH endonuclease
MPFSTAVREEALVAAGRCCCICRTFGGRNIEVHHIVPEASGGENTIDNAIPLCFQCHAEAGHYNPRHPRGTKYAPSELRRHRDSWYEAVAASAAALSSLRANVALPPPCAKFEVVECEVGTLWSHLANEPECREVVRFRGAALGGYRREGASCTSDNWELFIVPGGRFLVYHTHLERGDMCWASLFGKWGEMDSPLNLEELQKEYPELATSVGLEPIRVLNMNVTEPAAATDGGSRRG